MKLIQADLFGHSWVRHGRKGLTQLKMFAAAGIAQCYQEKLVEIAEYQNGISCGSVA